MADSELLLGQKSLGLLWEKLLEVQVLVQVQLGRNEMELTLTGDCMSQKGLDRAQTATAGSIEALTATADLAEAVAATADPEAATADTEAVPATADLAEVVSWTVLHLGKVQ